MKPEVLYNLPAETPMTEPTSWIDKRSSLKLVVLN